MYFVVAFMETFKQMEINKKPMQFHPPPLSQISRQKVALMYGVCVWLGGGGERGAVICFLLSCIRNETLVFSPEIKELKKECSMFL